MSFQLILGAAAVVMLLALAMFRVLRVRAQRDPPDGWRRAGLIAAVLVVPPLALQVVAAPESGPGAVDGLGAIALYSIALVGLWLLVWIAAPLLVRVVPTQHREMVLLALTGRDRSAFVPFDPPMSAALSAEVEQVESLNAGFPRGVAFMGQASLPGFRGTWEALDAATTGLEARIDGLRRLRLGVAEHALATAADARGRLDALRRDAAEHGQAWAR